MKIILITQDEPFYLASNLKYLIESLPNEVKIQGVILTSPSPFGKKESFLTKSLKTIRIFGIKFFLYYSLNYVLSYFNPNKSITF